MNWEDKAASSVKRECAANRTYSAVGTTLFATTPPFRQPIRSARTTFGTPPSSSKHSASIASVVPDRSLPANRTNRNRDQASTAQNTCSEPVLPQSIASTSPGVHTAGRRPRWLSRRHVLFASATSRRKFRAGPAYPAALAAGSSRFAEIRPFVTATRSAASSATRS